MAASSTNGVVYRPPNFPPGPSLQDRVTFGPLPTDQEYSTAYRAWNLPSQRWNEGQPSSLSVPPSPRGKERPESEAQRKMRLTLLAMESMVSGILQEIRRRGDLVTMQMAERQKQIEDLNDSSSDVENVVNIDSDVVDLDPEYLLRYRSVGPVGWGLREFHPDLDLESAGSELMTDPSLSMEIDGKSIDSLRVKKPIVARLRALGQKVETPKQLANIKLPELKKRLKDAILANRAALSVQQGILPRSDLSQKWGHDRNKKKFGIPWSEEKRYTPLEMFTIAIYYSPYNPAYWAARSYLYYRLGFYDLALGDAHRAERLTNVIVSPLGRTEQKGLHMRVWDAIEQHTYLRRNVEPDALEGFRKSKTAGPSFFLVPVRKAIYHTMALCLLALKSPYDYEVIEGELGARVLMDEAERNYFSKRLARNKPKLDAYARKVAEEQGNGPKETFPQDVERGHLKNGPRYPLDDPVDRKSELVVDRINKLYFPSCFPKGDENDAAVTMELESGEHIVKAAVDLSPGQWIYSHRPDVRGHLRRLLPQGAASLLSGPFDEDYDSALPEERKNNSEWDFRCENCKTHLPHEEVKAKRSHHIEVSEGHEIGNECTCRCLLANPMIPFCGKLPGTLPTAEDPAEPGTRRRDSGRKRKGTYAQSGRSTRQKTSNGNPATSANGASRPDEVDNAESSPSNIRPDIDFDYEPNDPTDSTGIALDKQPTLYCLSVAKHMFHNEVCNTTWRWLHQSMQMIEDHRTADLERDQRNLWNFERHGTILSLLFREVADKTLLVRARNPATEDWGDLFMHELNCMVPLTDDNPHDEKREWPFRLVANITNPFNILQALGIDIFRQLDFDTWVIQIVLRKLHNSIVAWYSKSETPIFDKSEPLELKDLYIHTGFSMFTHTCRETSNAEWMWDWWRDPLDSWRREFHPTLRREEIPNRILVRTNKAIKQGEPIKICHSIHENRKPPPWFQAPLNFEGCDCARCKERRRREKEQKVAQYKADEEIRKKKLAEATQLREDRDVEEMQQGAAKEWEESQTRKKESEEQSKSKKGKVVRRSPRQLDGTVDNAQEKTQRPAHGVIEEESDDVDSDEMDVAG